MRVLFLFTPVVTHAVPLVPLATAFHDAGHDVLAMGQPDIAPAFDGTGLKTQIVGDWYHNADIMLDGIPPGKRPAQVRPRLNPQNMFGFARGWAAHAKYMLPQYLPHIVAFEPDLIVADTLEYCSLLAGGAMGIPVVHHRWGVDPLSEPTLHILRESFLAGLARRMGLDTIPAPARVVDPCPPSLQEPGIGAGLTIQHLRNQDDATVPPDLLRELENSDRTKWVIVSMGLSTLGLNGASFVRNVIAAFDGLDGVRAVAPAGAAYRDQLTPVPANVRLIEPLPLAYSALHPLLARASAIVHHGGAGTTMQASAYGVPQLVLPQLGDQFAAGDALARSGAGITIADAAEQENPDRLREAVTELVFAPSYADGAAKLRDENTHLPTPAQVVSELERLA